MQPLEEEDLTTLINEIRTTISNSQLKSKSAISREQTKSYWTAGKALSTKLKNIDTTSTYGKSIFQKISESINIPKSTIYRMHQFYGEYKDLNFTKETLGWTHYKILLSVKDKDKRQELEDRIKKENLTTRQVENILKVEKGKVVDNDNTITENLGLLYHYKIREHKDKHYVDCGFKTYRKIKVVEDVSRDTIIHTTNKTDMSFEIPEQNKNYLYTYKAELNKMIDGDTFWLDIDLGFDTIITRKVRVRGVNTPELLTEEGQKAKEYVYSRLLNANEIILKSYHRDLYDRYLVDIYYKKSSDEEFEFLNMELLNENMVNYYMS